MNTDENNLHEAEGSEENEINHPNLSHSEDSRDSEELNTSKDEYEEVPFRDYKNMNMESLYSEVEHLLANYPVNRISRAVNAIKKEFFNKHKQEENKHKDAFVKAGGKPFEFTFNSAEKQKFNQVVSEYKKQLNAFYKTLEQKQKENLVKRQGLIEELKALYMEPSSNNSELFRNFRRIRSEWHDAGRVPAQNASDIFNTYFHHLDNFYEYLNLNKELQHLDYEHNLETRKTIISKAESLLEEQNIKKALNELQYLHKLWKEEAVPVAEEHREPTWNVFKEITQKIHDKKQDYYNELKEQEVDNQKVKEDIIRLLKDINGNIEHTHSFYQKTLKEVEKLRKDFIKSGRAPRSVNQDLWDEFKDELRLFNSHKNKFYKEMKSKQGDNLARKQELLEQAKSNLDREDWDEAVEFFKSIQREWKNVGMVPRKQSNEIWKEFNNTCNAFFEKFKNRNQKNLEELQQNLEKKEAYLEEIVKENFEGLSEDEMMKKAMQIQEEWHQLGNIPRGHNEVEQKLMQTLNAKMKESGNDADMGTLRRKLKVNELKNSGDEDKRNDSLRKIRSQMDEIRTELSKLENNLSFFANADKDNPLLKNVHNDIHSKTQRLESLQKEYDSLRNINFDEVNEENNADTAGEE